MIKQNEALNQYCTYKIGGPARVLFFAKNADEIVAGLEAARENNFPVFVLGGGSNVLFSDEGFAGLVLKIENNFIEIVKDDRTRALVRTGAGTPLSALVKFALDNSLTGMEWAAGIPGTLGGAIRGNAGAFHEEIANAARRVLAIKVLPDKFEKKVFEKADCAFSYRESVFKKNHDLIIVSAELVLEKGNKERIKSLMDEYLAKKATGQPLEYPSAGSVFVNPQGFFAGKIIEDCGLKGKIAGGAQISEKHANFIVNRGGARAKDVLDLITQIKTAAKEKFGVDLREEIEIVEAEGVKREA